MLSFGAGTRSWKGIVATVATLPASGNTEGDVRVALDTHLTYVWDGAAWGSTAGSGSFTPSDITTSTSEVTIGGGTGPVNSPVTVDVNLTTYAKKDSPTFTTKSTHSYATASTVAIFNASKELVSSGVTSAVLAFLDIGSSLTTLLGLKAPAASPTFTGTVTLPGSPVGIPEVFTGTFEAPTDKSYTLDESAAFAYRINTLIAKLSSGTCSIAVKINGTNVTGISAVSASSVQATGTSSAARDVAIGDRVTLVVSSSATPLDLAFTLKATRT